jgi:hypothetical protein
MKISSPAGSQGLGDLLILTSIVKQAPKEFAVQLLEEQKRFAVLFDKLANVEICKESELQPLSDFGSGHFARRKIRGLMGGLAEFIDIKPLVLYSDYASESWAAEYLKDKPNPLIICPFVAKAWSAVRDLPFDLVQDIISGAKLKNQTPIIIQSGEQKWGCDTLDNLELPKLICLMRQAGRVSTANTGLYHLAVAVGALVTCYQPKDGPLFNSSEWCYLSSPTIKHYTW